MPSNYQIPPSAGYYPDYDYDALASKNPEEARGVEGDTHVANKKDPLQALRFNQGKPELSYVLDYPRATEAVCRVMEYGANKYARDNWKKGGKPDSEYLDACLRHMYADKSGEHIDPESNCFHLAHAIWNLLTLLELNRGGVSID